MIFPWMFEDLAELRPLKQAAQLLAFKSDWPALYDRPTFATNNVPVAATCYYEDMCVLCVLIQTAPFAIGQH